MQKLYVDREGTEYYTWFYDEGIKRKFMTGPDLDVIYQKSKKQGFNQAILTPEASEFYYDRPNAPTKVKIGESKVNRNLEEKLRKKVKSIVENILNEDGNTVPNNATFTVVEGFKTIRKMMEVLENAVEGNKDGTVDVNSFWETYDNVLNVIRKKIDQIDNTAKRSR